jgi:hypothetical protein
MEELIRERRELWQMVENDQNEPYGVDGIELPFLPGIIIQGYDWNFGATVRETNKKTVSILSNVRQIYKIANHSNLVGILSHYSIRRYENLARPLSDNCHHTKVGILDTRYHCTLV